MRIKMTTNGYNIISSDTVILFDNNSELTLDIDTENNFVFSIIFKFESDASTNEHSTKVTSTGNNITLQCYNYNNSLGTGTIKPLELATVNGKKIYFHFWVFSLGDQITKKIDYTFFSER